MNTYKGWYENVYPDLTGFGLWLRGQELNTLPESEYSKRNFSVAFVRLSTYRDTADSFTHKLLYQIAKNVPGIFPDIAYLPPPNDIKLFNENNIPWIIGTKTKCGPLGFDLIGFSNSIVQELINIPVMLKNSGIPLSKSVRMKDARLPLIILGGANALNTSSLFSNDSVVDGIFAGEDTECIAEILTICRDGKKTGKNKLQILKELESIPGFIQPDMPIPTRKFYSKTLSLSGQLQDAPVMYEEHEIGVGNLQISQGCAYLCSFCSENWSRKPYREETIENLIKSARQMKIQMGLDDIEVYSFNFNMHSDIYRILFELSGLFSDVKLKSQRFDLLAEDKNLLEFLITTGKTSITCGMEGISARLRKYLHKNLSDEIIYKSLRIILKSPIRELKIFLIATGLENADDFKEFEELLNNIQAVLAATGQKPRIIFSLTPLVRFPWTPLEFDNAFDITHYEKIINKTEKLVTGKRFEFRKAADVYDNFISQILIRADNPQIYSALTEAINKTEFIYYRDIPKNIVFGFINELAKAGINPQELLKGTSKKDSPSNPWTSIETNVKRKFLLSQFNNSQLFLEEETCIGKKGKCVKCGACETVTQKKLTAVKQKTEQISLQKLKSLIKEKRENTEMVSFLIHANTMSRGVSKKMTGSALARSIMVLSPDFAEHYIQYCGSLWDDNLWVFGEDIITIAWNKNGIPKLKSYLKNPTHINKLNKIFKPFGIFKKLVDYKKNSPLKTVFEISSPFSFKEGDFLSVHGLKYIKKANSNGSYSYEFTKESLKKKIISNLTYTIKSDTEHNLVLVAGEKFKPEEFAQKAFVLPSKNDWVRILIEAKKFHC